MYRKKKGMFKAVVAIAVALAFVLPGATVFANDEKNINNDRAKNNVCHSIRDDTWDFIQITEGKYSAIAMDSDNIAHITWMDNINPPTTLYYANSSNGWEIVQISSAEVYGGDNCPPSICIDDNNIVYIAWPDGRNKWYSSDGTLQGIDIFYAKSSDGWVEHLATSETGLRCMDPSIVVDDTGDVHISYIRHTNPNRPYYNHQFFYVNLSGGWVETKVSFTPYLRIYWSSMDIDSKGIIHMAFSNGCVGDDPDGINHVWYANSSNGWVNTQIDSDSTSNWWDDREEPSIIIDSDDVAHVVWSDHRNTKTPHSHTPNRREIYYANSSSGWINTEIAWPNDSDIGTTRKGFPSVFVDDSGIVHATWLHKNNSQYDKSQNFFYSNSNNWNDVINVTTFGNISISRDGFLQDAEAYSSQNALAVTDNGAVHVTWWDNREGKFNIYYACSSRPPETPSRPEGPSQGVIRAEYTFSTSTTDPEGEQVSYWWDWGDGTYSKWIGPFDSGANAQANHSWAEEGDYNITVKAKDASGRESDWSDSKEIHISGIPILEIGSITGGIGKIRIVIKNIGSVDAIDVNWNFTLNGGRIFLGGQKTGRIGHIRAHSEISVSSDLIIGFGKTVVTVCAEIPESSATKEQNAFVFLFFIIVM